MCPKLVRAMMQAGSGFLIVKTGIIFLHLESLELNENHEKREPKLLPQCLSISSVMSIINSINGMGNSDGYGDISS